jgi:ABC-type multidrug transport system fused ATPase/permease subunit
MVEGITKDMDLSIKGFIKDYDSMKSKDTAERLKNDVDKIMSFFSLIFRYLVVSILVFLLLAVGLYFVYNAAKPAVIFFIAAVPIIIGISVLGVGKAISDFVTGINDIVDYTLEVVALYYKDKSVVSTEKPPSILFTLQKVFSSIVLPVIISIVGGRFLGKLILYSVSKAVEKLAARMKREDNNTNIEGIGQDAALKANAEKVEKIRKGLAERSVTYLKGFRVFIGIITFLCIVIGVPVMLLLIFIVGRLAALIH